jgi:hypothetical protein
MLSRALATLVAALMLPLVVVAPGAVAGGDESCPPGTHPVSVGSGVICVAVTDPGESGHPGDPGDPGDGGQAPPAGCYKSDGTEVSCQTDDGYWWSAYQCYAAPYDAPPGTPAWQGHTDGSLWQCTSCTAAGTATTCNVQIIWTAPGAEPGPPTPEQLASTAVGLMPLAKADVRTAPAPPDATYIGVENWLWIPDAQWSNLSKSVSAGATTVTVKAAPSQIIWNLGPTSTTCYGPGKPWVQGMTDSASTTCGYTYQKSSGGEPDGRFAIMATIRYRVTWSCTGTCPTTGGDLGLVDGPAGTSAMRVLQRQTVVVQ